MIIPYFGELAGIRFPSISCLNFPVLNFLVFENLLKYNRLEIVSPGKGGILILFFFFFWGTLGGISLAADILFFIFLISSKGYYDLFSDVNPYRENRIAIKPTAIVSYSTWMDFACRLIWFLEVLDGILFFEPLPFSVLNYGYSVSPTSEVNNVLFWVLQNFERSLSRGLSLNRYARCPPGGGLCVSSLSS